MSEQPVNLNDGLAQEIKRTQGLLEQYKELEGIPGVFVGFAVARIKAELGQAIDALASQDIVRMLNAYEELKGNE